ncbi:hypothetical protein JCM10212_001831 [Sporobolomyces blumeae]
MLEAMAKENVARLARSVLWPTLLMGYMQPVNRHLVDGEGSVYYEFPRGSKQWYSLIVDDMWDRYSTDEYVKAGLTCVQIPEHEIRRLEMGLMTARQARERPLRDQHGFLYYEYPAESEQWYRELLEGTRVYDRISTDVHLAQAAHALVFSDSIKLDSSARRPMASLSHQACKRYGIDRRESLAANNSTT